MTELTEALSRSSSACKSTGGCRCPLLLGVAGHRDLRDDAVAAIEREVRRIFMDLRERFPHTPQALISPLAAGADRLVATVAKQEGAALVVPLSWPAGIDDDVIHRTGDREGFQQLLEQADQVIHLPLVEGVTEHDVRSSEDAREAQYAQVGAYVARHSQILIALWDGVEGELSGTARVISWQQGGEEAPHAPTVGRLDELENGPVYQITTPRSEHTDGAEKVERIIRYPEGYDSEAAAADEFDSMWMQVDQINADMSSKDESFSKQIEQSKDWLIPSENRSVLPTEIADLLDRFACADAAAMKFQKATHTTLKGVFVLVAVAVTCFEFYSHLFVDWWPLMAIYLGLLLASVGWYMWSTRQSVQAKYLDYRSVAEALRVQLFWRLAGLQESVADYYLRNLRTELDWIRQAIRSINLVTGLHSTAAPQTRDEQIALLQTVRMHWIEDQLKYFSKTAPRQEEFHHRCAQLSRWFFWLAITLGMVLLVVHLLTHHMNHLLVVLVFVSVAAAALCHEYGEKQAFAIQAKRYDWMRSFYATAKRHMVELIEAGNVDDARELVLELGKESLQENAEWLLQHRQRPIKPPTV